MWSEWTEAAQRAFRHYGLDPDSRRYAPGRAQGGGWCEFCSLHSNNTPHITCDLEQARADEMAELGFECRSCAHCKKAYPKILSKAALCPLCYRRQKERDAKVEAEIKAKGNFAATAVRVPDGLGCTERLPAWAVDWDGNPNG